jgi:amino acid transporter
LAKALSLWGDESLWQPLSNDNPPLSELAPAQEGRRPRDLDWKRAAALLYGHWGASKAYVIGLAFLAAGFSSLPIILAVCAVTGLVGINYIVICRHFPDGGGVYSSTRSQGRLLAVVGALLLVADLTVMAALSGWSALSYITSGGETAWIKFLRDHIALTTIGVLLIMGLINYLGPKHSGSFAVALALPTAVVVVLLIAVSAPHLTTRFLEPRHQSFTTVWVQFVGVILALSGAASIANLTGVMKLDPGSTMEHPRVARESLKAILPVAIEVVVGTALLGWAMLSLPSVVDKTLHLSDQGTIAAVLLQRSEDMLRFVGEQFAAATFSPAIGQIFGWMVAIVFCLLLLSAANTAIIAMIDLLYMMSRDREMPWQFCRLNRHGVPKWPLAIAVGLPIVVLLFAANFTALAGLYAIGVVGAITVNLGSCTFNRTVDFTWYDRVLFGITFVILALVELTLAHTKLDALQFVLAILIGGLGLRAYSHKLSGLRTLTVAQDVADWVSKGSHTLHQQPQPMKGDPELSTEIAITTQTENFIFVCYKRDNMPQIKPILLSLCASGCEVWYDKGIPGAAEWDAAIEERIKNCKVFLLFLSQSSVDSKYVRREVKFADFCDKPILSVQLEQVTLALHAFAAVSDAGRNSQRLRQ